MKDVVIRNLKLADYDDVYELKTCEDISTEIMEIKTSQKAKEKQ